MENAVYGGIIQGFAGAFQPNQPITREEMAVVLVKALGQESQAGVNLPTKFTDAGAASSWAKNDVTLAVKDGLLNGYPDGSFRPLAPATRAEAVTVLARLLDTRHSVT